ncbi:ROK family glucokinase [Dactylosporangium matsuzakiense]|uniref:Glucokinase n=1 Tax=Dactylosporangium matsuzakiense TaxID=53360 RepID=A0A9W6NQY8_9ACTN|nr:ROK family glucokinase [Dactylosporangium matsuzakiense]UWZ43435.1 ROK family glucokinase [Dactylosporangium matsuzakiense]GLL05848.1 glucokinase [Dactylosporangium matsuzakiense]
MGLTIGVDIGGTKVLGGVVDTAGDVLVQTRRDTPAQDPGETADRIIEVIKELAAGHEVQAVGIGAAGWVDATRSVVQFAPNLAWRNEPLRDKIQQASGLPTVVENDGNAAAWAEFRFGAAHDADESMVLYTVGTGIGGGIIIGGRLIRGANGVAAEVGHTMMVPDGHPCGCGRKGCLEQYTSGNALVRFAKADAKARPGAAARLLGLAGGDPDAIVGPAVTEAARLGDEVAVGAFAQVGHWLGVGFADMVQTLDPQVIVVGGGVIDAGDLLLAPARASYREQLAQRGQLPVAEIRAALMGNLAGVVGAADLARM